MPEVVCPLADPARTLDQLYMGYFGRLIGGGMFLQLFERHLHTHLQLRVMALAP
jgi:hypothetical protein